MDSLNYYSLLVSAVICLMTTRSNSIPIDNEVMGIPQVQCEDQQVTMIFNTKRPFTGRIFVKGMSDKDDCAMDYKGNTGSSAVFQLKGGRCNMRRQRRLGPQRGVEQSMTVIVSFHDTFITKVDKAYRCTCFFMEADKVVTADFTVSMLPTTDLFDTAKMPACHYSVRRDSINGPQVTYARVGETLYHVWNCDSDMFGMLVHSCFVDDGTGNGKFQLLNQKGCAIDPVILGDLTYNDDGTSAHVEAHAFKFADKVTTYFQCAVSLCMKADGACVGLTPPDCTRRARFLRNVDQIIREVPESSPIPDLGDSQMDVAAEKIYVLDIDDENDPPAVTNAQLAQSYAYAPFIPSRTAPARREEVCLSPHAFGFMLASFLVVVIVAISATTVIYMKNRAISGHKA